jgi:hypothetical protein
MSQPRSRVAVASDMLTLGAFALAIGLPLLGFWFGWQPQNMIIDNRLPAPRPELALNLAGLRSLPARFEAYFDDRFGFRRPLIRWNNLVTVVWLGGSPEARSRSSARGDGGLRFDPLSHRLVHGEDGWFYHFGDGTMRDHRGLDPFSPTELLHWQRVLEQRRNWLAAQGIEYLFVAVPDKQSVYPEHLPARIRRVRQQTRMDQLVARLRARSYVDVLDLRTALIPAKSEELVFEQTDTHWNAYGAHVAYAAILERLAARFPGLRPRPLSDFEIRKSIGPAGPFLWLTGVRDRYQEPIVELLPRTPRTAVTIEQSRPPMGTGGYGYGTRLVRETARPELPSAVVLHDSFVPAGLEPLLSEHFRRVVYLWQNEFDVHAIAKEQPDLVIEEKVERYFVTQIPSNPSELRGAPAVRPRQPRR